MASLSWAQIAAKHRKPSSFSNHTSGDCSPQVESPRPALPLPVLTAADFPSIVKDKDKDCYGEEKKSSATPASRAMSPCTESVPGSCDEINGESGSAPSNSKKEKSSSTSSICPSPTSTSASVTTTDDENEDMTGNRKGHRAAKKAAEEVARQARLPASLEFVASVSSATAENNIAITAAAPLKRDEHNDDFDEKKHDEKKHDEKKHDEKKHDKIEEPGVNAALNSNGEEADLGGHRPDPSNMWSSTYILNNVMFYRPAMLLGVKSLMKYQIDNILKAADSLQDALDGRFFYYKFGSGKELASFEVPLRMAHIHLYTQNVEEEFADEIREMKVALAKLTLVVLPFLRRQYGFINNIQKIWEALPFPWRSEMEDFYHEGLLPDFPKCFDDNLQWVEEKTDDDLFNPRNDSSRSSRTSGMPYYQASVGEMTRRLTMAGFDSGYHL
ncbi:hypothetical protein LY76DRAFT_510297 [Colletotrichum caudatum]|nr:hypothetical protein LY76DRAFT_510297 [Colletotrichum caudatum]